MKAALVQQAMPGGTGTQDWTHAIFAGDAKNLLLFGTVATVNNTNTDDGALSVGSTDKTRVGTVSMINQDAAATTITNSHTENDECYSMAPGTGNNAIAEANLSGVSHPSGGIQINWADINAAELINGLLLGGDDIEVSTLAVVFTGVGPPETVSVAHQLSGAPDFLIGMYNAGGVAGGGGGGARLSLGFYDRINATYASAAIHLSNAAAAAAAHLIVDDASLLIKLNTTTVGHRITVGNFTATNFDVTHDDAATQTSHMTIIAVRGINARMHVKVGVLDGATSTGNFQPISGMTGRPQVAMMIPTRRTTINTVTSDDTAGHIGLGIAVDLNGTTQEAHAVCTDDDGADPTDAHSTTSNTQSMCVVGITGAKDLEATVNAWLPDGVQFNCSNAAASALKMPYLAFGMPLPTTVQRPRINPSVRM